MRRSCGVLAVSGEPFYTSADGEIDGPVRRRVLRMVVEAETFSPGV